MSVYWDGLWRGGIWVTSSAQVVMPCRSSDVSRRKHGCILSCHCERWVEDQSQVFINMNSVDDVITRMACSCSPNASFEFSLALLDAVPRNARSQSGRGSRYFTYIPYGSPASQITRALRPHLRVYCMLPRHTRIGQVS